jgi:hypothetical protein
LEVFLAAAIMGFPLHGGRNTPGEITGEFEMNHGQKDV